MCYIRFEGYLMTMTRELEAYMKSIELNAEKPTNYTDTVLVTPEMQNNAYKEFSNAIAKDFEESKKEKGERFDQGKPRTDLLSPIALMGIAKVLAYGVDEYGARNWQKGMEWGKVIGPLLRHTLKFMAGEDFDEKTKLPHVDHIAANAMFLQEYFRTHKDLDDREKTGWE